MAWDGIYRLQEPPLSDPLIAKLQDKALRGFGSYAKPLGVQITGFYDAPTSAFVAEYQKRKNASGYRPILPANPNAKPGDLDFETKRALGLVNTAPTPGSPPPYLGLCFPGTWGTWNIGPQIMAINRSPRVQVQGVQWNTGAFLNPDPQHSYQEALAEGIAEGLRLALPDRRPKVVSGYSMGADVVVNFLHQWPADRRDEIKTVITFGSPGKPPGRTKLGTDFGAAGISGVYTPDWAAEREYCYEISGDMYPEAKGYLPALYQVLTRMEASIEFAKYLFTWLTGIPLDIGAIFGNVTASPSTFGAGLLGIGGLTQASGFGALSGILGMVTPGPVGQTTGPISLPQMILNIPQIIVTLITAMKFVFTNAHAKYWVDPIFEGRTAEDHASMTVTRLTA